MKGLWVAAFGLALGGCSTIMDGKSQTISVNSNPPQARCEFWREDHSIATVEETPGSITITKNKHDVEMRCTKEGYQQSSQWLESGVASATFANFILGGVVGWGIDSATGADNKYPKTATATLVPVVVAAPAPAPQ